MRSLRLLRWFVQLCLLGLFVFLFVRNRWGAGPGSDFFRFDPLLLLVTGVATRTFVTGALLSLLIVGLTLVMGRWFCGWLCPLGTTIDLFDAVVGRRHSPPSRLRWGKYLALLLVVVAAALGTSFIGFIDPLVILERTLALVLHPAWTQVAGMLTSARPVTVTESLVALASFLVILGLGFAAPRFWCRNLCPLGGLYALLSKLSLFKFAFRSGCTECGQCARACPTGAIDSKKQSIDAGECIGCLACLHACRDRTIGYGVRLRPSSVDVGRREALLSLGSAVLLAPLARSLVHLRSGPRLVRPPGSLPEPDFLAACLRCAKCVKACPSGCLQPCLLESGPNGLWTPRAVGRIGGCEKSCHTCGVICPTGAIRSLPLEEKSYAVMGTAAIDRSRCIAWEQDKHCLVCDEACPYNAINAVRDPVAIGRALRPEVNETICVGCGICESRCPIAGQAAIQVFPIREERKRSGWYKTPARVAARAACAAPAPAGQAARDSTPAEQIPSGFITE